MNLSRYPENTFDKAPLKWSTHIASFFHLPMEPPLQTACYESTFLILWHGRGGGLWLLAHFLPSGLTKLGSHLRFVSQYYFHTVPWNLQLSLTVVICVIIQMVLFLLNFISSGISIYATAHQRQ